MDSFLSWPLSCGKKPPFPSPLHQISFNVKTESPLEKERSRSGSCTWTQLIFFFFSCNSVSNRLQAIWKDTETQIGTELQRQTDKTLQGGTLEIKQVEKQVPTFRRRQIEDRWMETLNDLTEDRKHRRDHRWSRSRQSRTQVEDTRIPRGRNYWGKEEGETGNQHNRKA